MKKFDTVDAYIAGHSVKEAELLLLREIALSTELTEEVKWGGPCYTFQKKNVLGIGCFKSYIGLWFYQGALLKDEQRKLMNAQEGTTKALRQWRFATLEEIRESASLIQAYIKEAIENQKQGKEIKADRKKPLIIPQELQQALNSDADFEVHFNKLTPGKKREYAEHISSAKREATRLSRIEKIIPMILEGKGLHDKYK